MASQSWITTLAFIAMAATPVFAQDGHHRRATEQRDQPRQEQPAQQAAPAGRDRAVPRTVEPRRDQQVRQQEQVRRDDQIRREDQIRSQDQARRQNQAQREYESRRQYDVRRDDGRRYSGGSYGRYEARPYSGYRYAPRIVRPTIIQIAPYRPYVYRPSWSLGVIYGSEGYYPYGATPRGYYDPIPGRYYGGVRITGAPRDAHVFADGYYVGMVDDFDGIFQHINLEAGPHHIEIEEPGFPPIAFDVYVRPGETITFRADDVYFR